MTLTTRAAIIAAVSICAASTLGATTPGFARQLDDNYNAVMGQVVPAPLPVPVDPATLPVPVPAIDAPQPNPVPVDPPATFTTLSAAVAAQSHADGLDDELRCLAVGVYHEAKGEPLAGQLAVAEVILNRTTSGRFPRSACSVLRQPGQFSFVRGGRIPSPPQGSAAWKTAVAVAKVARADLWDSPVPKALFFHARYVSPGWRMTRVGSVGNHIFYR